MNKLSLLNLLNIVNSSQEMILEIEEGKRSTPLSDNELGSFGRTKTDSGLSEPQITIGHKQISISGFDFSGVDFSAFDLTNILFSDCVLDGADLSFQTIGGFRHCSFSSANLERARLRSGYPNSCDNNFNSANLREAKFEGGLYMAERPWISDTSFYGADLERAEFFFCG